MMMVDNCALKTTELLTLKEKILWYVNYISIKLFFFNRGKEKKQQPDLPRCPAFEN